ncbi:hypothetical protein JVT61DRAFT_14525 [Boletus reticuloceps]|uniref:Uncharacterized protein n=1 Tax=Boletus reticuloceps TaxID=495285 RepID=A0A8I2YW61_9AGAM|nr:hypothetical protein JVT61DRAFT_14525 [Boletus reticuloceps]
MSEVFSTTTLDRSCTRIYCRSRRFVAYGLARWMSSTPICISWTTTSGYLFDVYALAETLRDKPILGYGFRHFTTNNVGEDWKDVFRRPLRKNPGRFTVEALITILRATKNVERVYLGHLDPRHTDALYAVLQQLRNVQTVSVGEVEEEVTWLLKHHRIDDACSASSSSCVAWQDGQP